jgi:hypothetical protein
MTTFIAVYHSGVVITNEISSYEFVGMKETLLLNEFSPLAKVVCLVRERLGWMDEGCEVWFEGWIDIGSSNGPWMKMMLPICNEEWTAYVGVVMKSEIHEIELIIGMVVWNDIGDKSSRSPTLPKAVDEQHVECGIVPEAWESKSCEGSLCSRWWKSAHEGQVVTFYSRLTYDSNSIFMCCLEFVMNFVTL